MNFDKNILEQAYDEEVRFFGIGPGATNRIKQFVDQVSEMIGTGIQLTPQQLSLVMTQMNMFTTRDIVAYCLQSYYDQSEEDEQGRLDTLYDSLYTSGIERTAAYFDDARCKPTYNPSYSILEYIETVLFRCFSNYTIPKGYKAKDIYRLFIRFGCIFNPRSNIIVHLFNNLSNGYYLRSINLDSENEEPRYIDRNIFTGQKKVVHFKSKMNSKITTAVSDNLEVFMMDIDYGNIYTLDARPYAFMLPTLFYMRDHNSSDYEGTKMMIMRRQEEQRQEKKRQEYSDMDWYGMGNYARQGGARKKSKKYKNMQHKNKSNRYGRKSKSRVIRRSIKRTSRRK
jgi:hypothetical protein